MSRKDFTEDPLFQEVPDGDNELVESEKFPVDRDLLDKIDEDDGELIEDKLMEGEDNDLLDNLDER